MAWGQRRHNKGICAQPASNPPKGYLHIHFLYKIPMDKSTYPQHTWAQPTRPGGLQTEKSSLCHGRKSSELSYSSPTRTPRRNDHRTRPEQANMLTIHGYLEGKDAQHCSSVALPTAAVPPVQRQQRHRCDSKTPKSHLKKKMWN